MTNFFFSCEPFKTLFNITDFIGDLLYCLQLYLLHELLVDVIIHYFATFLLIYRMNYIMGFKQESTISRLAVQVIIEYNILVAIASYSFGRY